MSKTQKYRDDHRDLVELVGKLQAELKPASLSKDAAGARALLTSLAAKISVHLAMEDKGLYPQLLQHKDGSVREKATRFATEMGGIKEAFTAYLGKYPNAQTIQGAASGFVADTESVIKVLGRRIQAEDADLYALVDRLT